MRAKPRLGAAGPETIAGWHEVLLADVPGTEEAGASLRLASCAASQITDVAGSGRSPDGSMVPEMSGAHHGPVRDKNAQRTAQGIAEHGRRSLPRPPHAVAKPQHPKGAARARACCVRSSPRARRSDMRVGQRIMRGTSRLPATASTSAAAGQTGCRVSSSVWRRIASLTRSSRRMTPARPGAVPRNRSQARCRLA